MEPDNEEKYIKAVSVSIYAIPDTDDETEHCNVIESVFNGNSSGSEIKIATIEGSLILGREIYVSDCILYDVCDAASADLEYVASVLEDVYDDPLDEITNNNFFYISQLRIAEEFRDYTEDIFFNLPYIIQCGANVQPDIFLYYPAPKEYEENIFFKIRHDIARIAHNEITEHIAGNNTDNNIRLTMDEAQINHILGRRVKDETYPESAKNLKEWRLFESLGFKEIENSRLLWKSVCR